MPEFIYKAQTPEGKIVEGKIDAGSESQAISTLHGRGLVVISVESGAVGMAKRDISQYFQRISNKDIAIFTRQLATLVGAEVPLLESLKTMAKQTPKPHFAEIVGDVAREVEGGASLSQGLAQHSDVFSDFYVRLVQSGELTGKLSDTLNQLASFLEKSNSLISKIKSALSYPIFLLVALIIVMFVMMTTVMPQLLAILEESGIEDLPLSTDIIVAITGFVNAYILFIIVGLVIAIVGLVRWIGTPGGREWWDAIKVDVPRVGLIARAFYMARLSESLSTLVKVNIPILDALKATSELVGNVVYKEILLEAVENVRGGGSVSEVFSKYEEIPPLVPSMLAIGEKSGKTDFMLDNLAKFYEEEADNAIASLTQIIEPALILILGVAVGVLVSAILLPIFSLVGAA
jgi:type IV pilus assembly protein PilC